MLEHRRCPAITVSVTLAEPAVIEGETHQVTVRLSQPSTQVERVLVSTSEGTATYGRDYFGMLSHQLVFMPGQTVHTIPINTLRDSAVEPAETFRITATPVNSRIRAGSVVAIIGDYAPPPAGGVADVRVTEGNAGTTAATFTITLSAPYPKTVDVTYTTRDRTATVADGDYEAAAGSLSFAPGETSKTVAVNVRGDRKLEPDETFEFVVTSITNATLSRPSATGTILNDETDRPGYQIDLVFISSPQGEVPMGIQLIAAQAAERWSQILVGDQPSFEANGVFVDDLRFEVQMGVLGGAMNGPNGPLANAGPRGFRDDGNGLPYAAAMGINPFYSSTVTPGERADMLVTLIHEIGHGLGLPGTAAFRSFVQGNFFTGPNAVREYAAIFGQAADPGGIPMETGGGAGTAGAHWDEDLFGAEIMTGILDSGVANPISRITVGALHDIGYEVNYAAADRYTPPSIVLPPGTNPGLEPPPVSSEPPPSDQEPPPPFQPPTTPGPQPEPPKPTWGVDPTTRRLPPPPWLAGGSGTSVPAVVPVGPSLRHRTSPSRVTNASGQSGMAEAALVFAALNEQGRGELGFGEPEPGTSRRSGSTRLFATLGGR